MPIALAPFDPSRDFIAQTNFRAGGRIWLRKSAFDKAYVNERVLGQLYEARKIAYAADESAKPVTVKLERDGEFTLDEDTGPLEFNDVVPEQNSEEASGTAREAPGASESTDAESGSANASETPAADAPEEPAPVEGEGAGASTESETPAPTDPLDHDADGKKGGSLPDNTGNRETLIKRLVDRHDHAHLFARAAGLKGVRKAQTKTEIATALVDAGRVGDGTA